ncbi:sensor histidine kinase [Streptacidiphilus carbonis]|uniref:sensor histidine kinase n=1 Tax=Streptacidiphilus carbonis TaxID=105422 RepID=UPI0005AA6AFD|nr:sensor histidine kinase [Streptacidiphilus carbonis]
MSALSRLHAPRRVLPRVPPLALDGAVAFAQIAVGLQLGLHPQSPWQPLDAGGIALTCLIGLVTVARRFAPLLVVLVCCALWTLYVAIGFWPVVNSLTPMVALYTLASLRPRRQAALGAVLMAAVWVYAGLRTPGSQMTGVLIQALAFPAVLWRFGDAARQLSLRNQQLALAAEQLCDEHEQRSRLALSDERTRIARELHDVVAHHMAVVSVQAGLARYVLDSDRDTAAQALDTVLETASEALEELRHVLALLRTRPSPERPEIPDGLPGTEGPDGPAPYSPAAGLAQLPDLTGRVTSAGVPVRLDVSGPVRLLAPGPDLCAYRVAQESLTNTLKHAPGARATVALHYGSSELTLRISNDRCPPGYPAPLSASGSSAGLLGMRERAELYGGQLRAGESPLGGFEVILTLPLPGARPARHQQ